MTATESTACVETAYGPVRGADDGPITSWKGVRYAAPPTGDLRWRAPQPPEKWTEVADASALGRVCPQPVEPRIPIDLGAPQGDDCLTLNVWASSDTAAGDGKPVMVWVHGGAYILGSASQPLYDGRVLAARRRRGRRHRELPARRVRIPGSVVVRAHQDAGSTPTSGCATCSLALQWVRDNIAAFGGDPDRVTLFGESAGAGIVTTLLTTPAAAGLFSAAIAQSSPATSVYDAVRGRRVAEEFLDILGLRHRRRRPVAWLAGRSDRGGVADVVQRRAAAQPRHAGLRADRRRRPCARLSGQAGARGPLASGAVDHRHQQARGGAVQVDEVAADADHARGDQGDVRRNRRRAARRCSCPTEDQIGAAYRSRRTKTRGMGVARDVGFRMPSVWLAEGHSAVAPVYLYRFDCATPMLRLLRHRRRPRHRIALSSGAISSPAPRTPRSSWVA